MRTEVEIDVINKSNFKTYESKLMELFHENFFLNGGMLYSDDFLINSDFIIIAKANNRIVGYMAVCNFSEKDLDREYETYQEELFFEKAIVIKHLVVKKEYRRQRIATKLFEYIKFYAVKNGIKHVYLWTTVDNVPALSFYKKEGFHKMGDYNPKDGTFQGLNRISFYYDDL